jgi:alpha-N-arabinofuranosidase
MSTTKGTRRDFLKVMGAGVAAASIPVAHRRAANAANRWPATKTLLSVDPQPKYALSLNLYQQFMEPLGTTDGSVAAAWDFRRDCWREDVIETTKELGPSLLRWGGCFASYYRWKEAVGPRDQRVPMLNLLWGGVETNQVGTHEFIDFARQVGAEPFFCVNMESDGREYWMKDPKGRVRKGDANEAAEWVDYCNNPKNELRRSHGVEEPYGLKLWQLGNETSYDPIDREWGARKTVEFAKAMRQSDPTIELIGWGDSGWMKMMYEIAGEHLQYLAFHHMFDPYRSEKESPLRGIEYRKDPDRTWEYLMNSYKVHEDRVRGVCEEAKDIPLPLAMTECHFALPGRNRCEVLSTWAAGVANARMANVHERYGEKLKIATLADFCGTRWQVNAVMIPVPGGHSFMMPVARIMSLYRHHQGEQAIDVTNTPDGLDAVASITGDRVYLHVVNTQRTRSVDASLQVAGKAIKGGRAFTLAGDPEFEVFEHRPDILHPVETPLPTSGEWTVPPASVSAVELDVEDAEDTQS